MIMSFKKYNSNNAAKHITTLASDLNGGYWGSINYKRQKPSSSTLSSLSSTTTLSSDLTSNGDNGNSFKTEMNSSSSSSSSSSSFFVALPSFMSPIVTPDKKKAKKIKKKVNEKNAKRKLFCSLNVNDDTTYGDNTTIATTTNASRGFTKYVNHPAKRQAKNNRHDGIRTSDTAATTTTTTTTSSIDCTITDSSIDGSFSPTIKHSHMSDNKVDITRIMDNNKEQNAKPRPNNYSSAITQMFHNLEYEKDLAKYKIGLMNDVNFLRGVTVYLQQAISLFWREHEKDIQSHSRGFDSLLEEEEEYMMEAFNIYVRKSLGLKEKPHRNEVDLSQIDLSQLNCWKALDPENDDESTSNEYNNEKSNTFCPLQHHSVSKESLACPSPAGSLIEKEVSLSPLFGITSFTPAQSPDLFDLDSIFDTDEGNWASDLSKWNNDFEDILYV